MGLRGFSDDSMLAGSRACKATLCCGDVARGIEASICLVAVCLVTGMDAGP